MRALWTCTKLCPPFPCVPAPSKEVVGDGGRVGDLAHGGCQGLCRGSDAHPRIGSFAGGPPHRLTKSQTERQCGISVPHTLSARCVSSGLKFNFRFPLASISCFLCNPLAKIPRAQRNLEGKVQDMETNVQCPWHRELISP